MKEILCDSQIFWKLKAVDSYCTNNDIGLVISDDSYVLDTDTIQRICDNKWNLSNNYQLVLCGPITKNKLASFFNASSQNLIQKLWIPHTWPDSSKITIQQYCDVQSIQLKELD